jgi:YidC/Oxa1 family membrane protein insertase
VDTRRLILALVLSFAVLAAWSFLFPQPERRPPPPEPAAVADTTAGESAPEAPPGDGAAANEAQADTGEALLEAPAVPEEEILTDAERTVVVENDRIRAELSNRGAVIVGFELKDHQSRAGGPVDLVRRRAAGPFPFALVASDDAPLPLDGALFTVEESGAAGARQVVFRYRGPAGDAEKRFFFGGSETFEVEVEVRRPRDWGLWLGPGLRNPTPDEVDTQFSERGGVYLLGGEVERVDAKKAEEPVALPGGGLGWAGLDDHYFLTALIPREGGAVRGVRYRPMLLEPAGEEAWTFSPMPAGGPSDEQEDLPREVAMVVEPSGQRLELRAFWGAKDLERLAAAAPGLDETVTLGMFGWFARFLLVGLLWIHDNVAGNYGWAIVLLTVAIKLVLLPLTHKSYISMRKMQALAPKMQAIRERYRPKMRDKKGRPDAEMQRKMNEEIMGLYKAEKVNPAGGCLPMLLQLPVLFAFYRLLYAAVELRGAPWILWIGDLSAKDPYYVLPIVMGATQFIQMRMTPMAGDPMQRRIFQLMPVFMTVLFLGFPSGLVLYWLTNNVLTIAQQAVYNRVLGDKDEKAEGKKGAKKGKGGRNP